MLITGYAVSDLLFAYTALALTVMMLSGLCETGRVRV
jgi:hypothetical protein